MAQNGNAYRIVEENKLPSIKLEIASNIFYYFIRLYDDYEGLFPLSPYFDGYRISNTFHDDFLTFVYLQPSAVEDLRKWTSYEAIGDVTVMPSCVARVGVNSTFMSTSATSPSLVASSSTSADVTDDIIVVSNSSRLSNNEDDMPLDHRLPSPEEQSHLIALK